MHLERIHLTNYRCYRDLEFELPEGRVVMVGDNAQGKSSLMEALMVTATLKSAHGAPDRDLVRWGAGQDDGLAFARAAARVQAADGQHEVEVLFLLDEQPGESTNGQGAAERPDRRVSKRVRVDGIARRALDAVGVVRAVLFAPQHLELVDGPPSARRRYLDVLLCQLDSTYCKALARYTKVLANRNHLLRQLRGRSGDGELDYWDQTLAESGGVVLARRAAVVAELSSTVVGIHTDLSGSDCALTVSYAGTVAGEIAPAGDAGWAGTVNWTEALRVSLASARKQEIARGMTLAGPHRDDLTFTIDGVDLRAFGSRGQQRTAALALKLAEADLLRSPRGDPPVVLLDDVMSELDASRRAYLADRLSTAGQVVVTTTDLDHVPESFRRGADIVGIREATLVPQELSPPQSSPPSAALQGVA